MTPSDIEKLRQRLRSRPRTLQYAHICRETGLTQRWLQDFLHSERKPHKSLCLVLSRFLDEAGVNI